MIINVTFDDQLNSVSFFYGIMGMEFIELTLCNNVHVQLGWREGDF